MVTAVTLVGKDDELLLVRSALNYGLIYVKMGGGFCGLGLSCYFYTISHKVKMNTATHHQNL